MKKNRKATVPTWTVSASGQPVTESVKVIG